MCRSPLTLVVLATVIAPKQHAEGQQQLPLTPAPPRGLWRWWWRIVLLGLCAHATATEAFARTFTTLDHPLAVNGTIPQGVSGDMIAGTYRDASDKNHGFKYSGTTYTPLDHPLGLGGSGTVLDAIDGANIGGSYYDGSNNIHGFLYNGSTFSTLESPLGSVLAVYGISGTTVVGRYLQSGLLHGYLYDGASWISIDGPVGAVESEANGIDGSKIVGSWWDTGTSGNRRGFVFDGSSYTVIEYPSSTMTTATGISGSNIVGTWQDSGGMSHGFVYNGSSYSALDDPFGVNGTSLNGIDGQNVVGSYRDSSGALHGFVTTIPEPSAIVLLSIAAAGLLAYARPRRIG